MRPVKRGRCPTKNGRTIRFAHYREARDFLVRRIGDYCSYCEIPKPDGPDVEHVRPQKHYPQYEKRWCNFLLACKYCNRAKWDRRIVVNQYYWPERHNTFLAFTYCTSGPIPAAHLTVLQRARAITTIQLTGLDRRPGHPQFSSRDTRWRKREEVWRLAEISLDNLYRNNTSHMRDQVVISALGHGFWSVWMTVFKNEPDVLRLLIEKYPGTATDCFDANGMPVSRPGGLL
jgi:hypothetical protein